MMIFTQNDWSQREIINKVIILTKQGTDTIHAVIPKKCQNYPSTTILKHVFFGGKVNKFSFVVIGKGLKKSMEKSNQLHWLMQHIYQE